MCHFRCLLSKTNGKTLAHTPHRERWSSVETKSLLPYCAKFSAYLMSFLSSLSHSLRLIAAHSSRRNKIKKRSTSSIRFHICTHIRFVFRTKVRSHRSRALNTKAKISMIVYKLNGCTRTTHSQCAVCISRNFFLFFYDVNRLCSFTHRSARKR